jgi:uncharacterized GH25 family protein
MRAMSVRCAALLALLGCVSPVSATLAHDFWVEPREFWLAPDSVGSMTLQVGHGPSRQRSPIPRRRITRFAAVAPDGTLIDLRGNLDLGGASQDGNFRLPAPGAYVLLLETDDAYSRLPANRFNEYLQAEGLTAALEQRRRTHRLDQDGFERYSRRAKAIVYVGPPGDESQAQVTRPLGLKLEIVPEISPYPTPRPATLPLRVIYEQRPLPGALVKLTNLEHDDAPVEMRRTDGAGRAEFVMPDNGAWLFNVIWSRPLDDTGVAEFETVFSSLAFGFPGRSAAPWPNRPCPAACGSISPADAPRAQEGPRA